MDKLIFRPAVLPTRRRYWQVVTGWAPLTVAAVVVQWAVAPLSGLFDGKPLKLTVPAILLDTAV